MIAQALSSGTSIQFLAGVGGIGWLLTIYCLWDKFDPKKDKAIHLLSDIVNATFTVITLVAAVSIALNFSVRLPDLITNRVVGEVRQIIPKPEAPPATLAQEIIKLNKEGRLTNASLTEVLQRQFKGLSYYESRIILKLDQRQVIIGPKFEGVLTP